MLLDVPSFPPPLPIRTRLPCPYWTDHHPAFLMRSAMWFPALGALVGCWAGVWYSALATLWSPGVAAALSTLASVWLTGSDAHTAPTSPPMLARFLTPEPFRPWQRHLAFAMP